MADILLDAQVSPVTPATGQAVIYIDSTLKRLMTKDDAGFVGGHFQNASIANQTPTAATRTYVTGSALKISKNKLQVGSMFRWKVTMTKTAAGVAASTITIAVGTAGTTADTDRLTFTKPLGTAVVDEGVFEVFATVRSIGASGIVVGEFTMIHNLATTGHMAQQVACSLVTSAGFDMTVADLIVGLTITTGAADAITISVVHAEALNA